MASDRGRRARSELLGDELPKRIRADRERLKMSVRELARRLEMTPSAISQIETGRARPSVSTLYGIVTELGMSLDELFASNGAAATPRLPATATATVVADGNGDGDTAPETVLGTAEGVGLGDGARGAGGVPRVVRAGRRQALDLESGVRWERLTAAHDPDVDFLFVRYEVGGASNPNDMLMRHSGREYGLILVGELEVTVGFDSAVLGPGDSISFDSTTPHRLRTHGDSPAEAIWLVIGRHGAGSPEQRI
jgi:transcriptional regulator with XRE-family HTH domain/mannose-6-phosphate isomerase-like protein (cupin superfamily)